MSTPIQTPDHPVALSMPKADLVKLCMIYGSTLDFSETDDGIGKPIDGPTLLWALCGRESNFGRNLKPRHEPAYDVNGCYWRRSAVIKAGVAQWGPAFACSYGPLQIMACNAHGFTPVEMGSDPEKAFQAAVARLRIEVLGRQKARTIDEICDSWNTGNDKDANVPTEYIADVRHHYLTEVIAL
jgi:hypothetical protein